MQPEEVLLGVQLPDFLLQPVDQHPEFYIFGLRELNSVEGVHVFLYCVVKEVVEVFHRPVDLVAELVLRHWVVVFQQVAQALVELTVIQ